MNTRWISSSFVAGALLLAVPGTLVARDPNHQTLVKTLKPIWTIR